MFIVFHFPKFAALMQTFIKIIQYLFILANQNIKYSMYIQHKPHKIVLFVIIAICSFSRDYCNVWTESRCSILICLIHFAFNIYVITLLSRSPALIELLFEIINAEENIAFSRLLCTLFQCFTVIIGTAISQSYNKQIQLI